MNCSNNLKERQSQQRKKASNKIIIKKVRQEKEMELKQRENKFI